MEIKSFAGYAEKGWGVWVQRSSHGSHNPLPEHGHDFIELVYVVHGGGRHLIDREAFDIRAGDIYAVAPGESHAFPDAQDRELEIINCLFQPETVWQSLPADAEALLSLPYVAPLYQGAGRLPRKLTLPSSDSAVIVGLLESMMTEIRERKPGSGIIVRQRLIDILITLSRVQLREESSVRGAEKPGAVQAGGYEILVRKVLAYLESHYPQRITAAELAEVFAISSRHLNRVFRQETGRSITETLQGIRIERAKIMLHETARSVEGISAAVGFGDPSFFSKLFSRTVGHTPGEYRRIARSKRSS
ncbi:AraC family transcriptional regulator [Paenibacillus mucilaginosus]|uniref:AraC family transcriptional regulator n=3 Tax=Paenibacillus mucilaginosus TaxID=61624 RepID=H6NPY1_9BACL|nr:AraC family transcriptional regulator [Paenibacillus mucilaginosus]AEI43531.1 transcriptional regulator, AraC family [Paenibacillus mucilaginosus KNP414]AFC31172.1 AraC family transcriptional regulator [Paenibacillus mucilaginosus 3016]AFH63493.1 AraC family transcriptional regulator [Paenibacillus mucilaginosus K02]MCG7211928.1 AraC family transcriptional regulator [Paenibacillus mucilaginosus]WDM25078.1 helix-turn-helix domain-containing protein [Paenibacillus mucilaginosus]